MDDKKKKIEKKITDEQIKAIYGIKYDAKRMNKLNKTEETELNCQISPVQYYQGKLKAVNEILYILDISR